SFHGWWQTERRSDGWIYVAATVLAGWLHVITLPFTLAPFLYCGVRALRPFARTDWIRLASLGVATALPLALALLPPLLNDWEEFSQKAARDSVTLESVYRTALMLAGTGSPIVGALFWIAVVCGFQRLVRHDPELGSYVATVVGVPTVVVSSSGAEW